MRKLTNVLFGSLIMLTLSCTEGEQVTFEKNITVDEVQNFVGNFKGVTNARTNNTEILWDESAYRDISLGDALLFPVGDQNTYVSVENGPIRLPVSNSLFALAYKTGEEVNLELVQPVVTANTEFFTGYYLISDWGGDVKRVLEYSNGNFINELGTTTGGRSSGRSNSSDCFTVTYWECTRHLSVAM
ncbi:MAG: hypothetical protein AAFN93_21335 [Bacteroidota bacterium]